MGAKRLRSLVSKTWISQLILIRQRYGELILIRQRYGELILIRKRYGELIGMTRNNLDRQFKSIIITIYI